METKADKAAEELQREHLRRMREVEPETVGEQYDREAKELAKKEAKVDAQIKKEG